MTSTLSGSTRHHAVHTVLERSRMRCSILAKHCYDRSLITCPPCWPPAGRDGSLLIGRVFHGIIAHDGHSWMIEETHGDQRINKEVLISIPEEKGERT